MKSLAARQPTVPTDDRQFFRITAMVVAVIVAAGFGLQVATGRSSFSAPMLVHAHAMVFTGWVAIFVAQATLAATDHRVLHRRLGWIAAAWMVPMVLLGFAVTLAMVRDARVPFFFRPLHFLVFDPATLVAFVGLTGAAIANRRRSDWHRRLHLCAMAVLLGPALGRLLPMPLLTPLAFEATFAASMLLPLAGIIADRRRSGRVHPAWRGGLAALLATFVVIETVTYSPPGTALYAIVTAGTPGAGVAPMAFPLLPEPSRGR